MVSNQILQNAIDGLKSITRQDMTVIEREGRVVATTHESQPYAELDGLDTFIASHAESQSIQGYQYFKVFDNGVAEYIVIIKGVEEESYLVGRIAAFQLQSLIVAYKERYDKDNFIKNLLMDNLLLVDIYSRAKKLRIENNVRRVVFLIEAKIDKDMNVVDIIRNIFPERQRDFVTAVGENNIILVKELKEREGRDEVNSIAKTLHDTVSSEAMCNVFVAVGTVVTDLKNVSASFKEATMALEVGKIFEAGKNIVNYEQLGVGRLIYQLPTAICKIFVDEVLHGQSLDRFDEEMFATADTFFENNLNVSETARQLYIHRNTLVYRLDKLQKLTGLDLRSFDDAIIFKITLMVYKYMEYKEKLMY